jgi:hypothetical protein
MSNRLASCSCGQLRVATSEEPLRVSVCHCLACQRRTGSAFGAQARFRKPSVKVTGTSSTYVRVSDAGNKLTFYFCPQCGATVHYELESQPGLVAVPVGAFAEPGFPSPSRSVYESRMHPWVGVPCASEHIA